MRENWEEIARATLQGSETDTMTFPESVKALVDGGFDGYAVDFRHGTRTYYLPSGETLELKTQRLSVPVSDRFDATAMIEAIREAQQRGPNYSYKNFCEKAMTAGCAGYLVSLVGKRVVYLARSGETHIEYFPGTKP